MEGKDIIKPRSILENIKSKYILKLLFNNLSQDKFLIIIKHNKNIQNKLNINKKTIKKFVKQK